MDPVFEFVGYHTEYHAAIESLRELDTAMGFAMEGNRADPVNDKVTELRGRIEDAYARTVAAIRMGDTKRAKAACAELDVHLENAERELKSIDPSQMKPSMARTILRILVLVVTLMYITGTGDPFHGAATLTKLGLDPATMTGVGAGLGAAGIAAALSKSMKRGNAIKEVGDEYKDNPNLLNKAWRDGILYIQEMRKSLETVQKQIDMMPQD